MSLDQTSTMYKIFDKIKNKYSISSIHSLQHFIAQFDNCINLKCFPQYNIVILFTQNISPTLMHHDPDISDLIYNCKHCIIDMTSLSPILSFFNNLPSQDSIKKN